MKNKNKTFLNSLLSAILLPQNNPRLSCYFDVHYKLQELKLFFLLTEDIS